MQPSPIDAQAEEWLRGVAAEMTAPRARECLLCFVRRMLEQFGCDTTLRFARHFRDRRAPRAIRLERRLGQKGGYCDCEIFVNGWAPHRRLWSEEREVERDGFCELIEAEPPPVLPPCDGVRLGSTQGCTTWEPRRRGW